MLSIMTTASSIYTKSNLFRKKKQQQQLEVIKRKRMPLRVVINQVSLLKFLCFVGCRIRFIKFEFILASELTTEMWQSKRNLTKIFIWACIRWATFDWSCLINFRSKKIQQVMLLLESLKSVDQSITLMAANTFKQFDQRTKNLIDCIL